MKDPGFILGLFLFKKYVDKRVELYGYVTDNQRGFKMKKCVVKLIWLDENGTEEVCEYIVMDLDLDQSIYSQIYEHLFDEGPTFDTYAYQEITI